MKKNMKLNFMLMSGVLLFGMYSCTPGAQDYSSYVNPFIGTGGHGPVSYTHLDVYKRQPYSRWVTKHGLNSVVRVTRA